MEAEGIEAADGSDQLVPGGGRRWRADDVSATVPASVTALRSMRA